MGSGVPSANSEYSMRSAEFRSVQRHGEAWRPAGLVLGVMLILAAGFVSAADERPIERGEVQFTPTMAETSVTERFRLEKRVFAWEAERMRTVTETLEVWDVRFPSPVKTAEAANNTVH